MERTGSALLAVLVVALPALAAEPEFRMSVDRTNVGTRDTFRLDIVVGDAPPGAQLVYPQVDDFEVLSRSQTNEMNFSMGPGGTGAIRNLQKYTLVMRANRAGTLTIPPAGLKTAAKTYRTEPIVMEVVEGQLSPPQRARPRTQTPFAFPPGFPFPGGNPFDEPPDQPDDTPDDFDEPKVPRGEADLFIRSSVDKPEVWVGEQVLLGVYIYSRIDLMSVDAVTMPKLEGFWSQDSKSPSELRPEEAMVNGVRYRRYLLRQKALFPMKSGTFALEPAEADITTGLYLTGSRVHKKGNALTVKVKALPPGGDGASLVGQWRLSRQLSTTDVALGEPVQVRLVLEGHGNLQAAQTPALEAPAGVKVFDPETTDKPSSGDRQLGGQRVVEYTLLPQRTGTFTLPAARVRYFDPATAAWQTSAVDALTFTVRPGANGATATGTASGEGPGGDGPKNQLVGGGLRALRHTARFAAPGAPLWARPWFLPLAVAPLGLGVLLLLGGALRERLGRVTPEGQRKLQERAARARLSRAHKLAKSGKPADFYAEVERALTGFLEAKVGEPLIGLTRADLAARLEAHGVPESARQRIDAVLDSCALGRYAPGMADPSSRQHALSDAAAAMGGW